MGDEILKGFMTRTGTRTAPSLIRKAPSLIRTAPSLTRTAPSFGASTRTGPHWGAGGGLTIPDTAMARPKGKAKRKPRRSISKY